MKKQTMWLQASILWCMTLVTVSQFFGCSSAVQLVSSWKQTDITIDGKQNDWQGDLYSLKKAMVTIGIRNDDKNLYLCFISNEKNVQRQIMGSGFTVWFDPTGGTDETYGIQFPVGFAKGEVSPAMGGNLSGALPSSMENMNDDEMFSDNNAMPPPMRGRDSSMHALPEFGGNNSNNKTPSMFNSGQSEVKFLGPKKDDIQLSTLIELKTVKVQVGGTRQSFVYELQVPLHKTEDFPFTLASTDAKNIIGIEFKTESHSSQRMRGPGGRGGMGESEAGGMGAPGGMSEPVGGINPSSSDPIEVWTKVILAQK